MKKILFGTFFFLICCTNHIAAQVDTEFWFAVPSLSLHTQSAEYHLILFSQGDAADVQITMPANPSFAAISTHINTNGYQDILLAEDYNAIENNIAVPYNTISNRALLITSTAPISGYLQITHNNGETFAFKGSRGLGTEFFILGQNMFENVPASASGLYTLAYHSVQIVATQNNTHITIKPSQKIGISCTTTPISITLQRGETYAFRACGKAAEEHIVGTLVTADHPIAVNSTDDSVFPPPRKGTDMAADQLVSVDYWGTDYIAVSQGLEWEALFITAKENGTQVQASNGMSYNINRGQTKAISLHNVSCLYLHSNKPIGVYQLTGLDDEPGGAQISHIGCTGSSEIKYKRFVNSQVTIANIVTYAGNINSFTLNDIPIAPTEFSSVPGCGGMYYYASIDISSQTNANEVIDISCSAGLFHLGILDVESFVTNPGTCTYGYFSDYGTAHEYDEYATFAEGTAYTWKNHFLPGTTTPMVFTSAGVYTDNLIDKNGCDSICVLHLQSVPYPDNVVDVECVVPPVPSNFEIVELFKCDSIHSMSTPLVADIDGDGNTDIISCKWSVNSAIAVSDGFLIIDGRDGKAKYSISTVSYPLCGQPITIADVNGDGKCEIFLLDLDNYVYCYSYNGILKWKSSFSIGKRYLPQLCDFNHDGQPELVLGKYILNSNTGILLCQINLVSTGMGFGAPHGVHFNPTRKDFREYYLYAVADIDNDGTSEICAGNTIYRVNIVNFEGSSGNSSGILRQAENISSIYEYDGQTFVVDFDGDGDLDVCVVGISHDLAITSPNPTICVYAWDGQTNQILAYSQFIGSGAEVAGTKTWTSPSIPYCGDLDGDGSPEITFSIKKMGMMSYKYNPSFANKMQRLHNYAPFSETCGYNVFDFNKDGRSEIVYRNDKKLSIVDGITLDYLCAPIEAFSGTLTEYPVVADVNGDGAAEIIINRANHEWPAEHRVTEDLKGWTSVYGSSKSGAWNSARKVWNQWVYTSACINDDMTVPRYQYNAATLFPNGTKPFNTFLSQVPIIDKQGDIFVPAADAAVTSCSNTIQNDSIQITVNFCNNGDANLVAPYEITTYQNEYRGTVIQIDTIKEGLGVNECKSITIKVPSLSVCKAVLDTAFIIAINDDGHGIAQHGNQQAECDTTNNRTSVLLPTDFRSDTTKYTSVICATELPYTFTPTGTLFPVGTTSGRTIISKTNKYGCDSIITIDLTVNPTLTGDTMATFCNGTPFIWHGVDFSTAGDYPYTYTSKVAPYCDSIVTLHLSEKQCCPIVQYTVVDTTICDTIMPYKWLTWETDIINSAGYYEKTLKNDLGCDSIIYQLQLNTYHCCAPMNATINIPNVCADAPTMPIQVNLLSGEISEYSLHFTNPPLNKMPFRDTTITIETQYSSATPIILDVPIPFDPSDSTKYPRPDDSYKLSLSVRDSCGNQMQWGDNAFTIMYPSWITEQHWDDVIAIVNDKYNGGYTFSKVEWLRDGETLPGENNLYIYLPHELWTNPNHQQQSYQYQALLTRSDDGKTIISCPIEPKHIDNSNLMDGNEPYVDVTPIFVPIENPVVHVMTNTKGTYWLYDAAGKLLQRAAYEPCEHTAFDIQIPGIRSMYVLVFTPTGEKKPLDEKYRVVRLIAE